MCGNKKKKIVIITNHSYMFWQFRRELVAELQKENEVVLGMPFVGHEEDFTQMGVRCVEIGMERRSINPSRNLQLIKTYWKLLKSEKPDIVITYSIKPNIYAGLICSILKIPYFANVQGLGTAFQKKGLAFIATILYKLAFIKVQNVFFENSVNAKEFRARHIMKKEKQTVLCGAGINTEHYSLEPYPYHEHAHFLYLGRIMKEKGIDELFAAVRRLHKEGYEFVLDMVGFFEDEYQAQVKELEKLGIVKFHGFQPDTRPFYKNASCVVLPSYHEGMSNVLLEAAATGRPLITSNIPGCREAVEHGKTGILVKVKDSESLYKAMKRFLTISAEKRAAMGIAGREKMEQEFKKEKVVAETLKVLGMKAK